jgi:hypothetical protein
LRFALIDGAGADARYWHFLFRRERAVLRHLIETTRVSKPPLPLDQSAPQDGDVLVTREAHSPVRYTVRQLPGSVQFSAAVRDDAVRLARGFGQKHAVDVWYGESGAYRLLEAYRPRTARASSAHHISSKD